MLTAIRNICSTIFDYDEHRFGREESMEASIYHKQFCYDCGASWRTNLQIVDGQPRCEFCRLGNSTPRLSRFARVRGAISRLIAPRQQDISILKSEI
jgi:hypothetical protein